MLPNRKNQSNCLSRWWNQNYHHQKRLESFLEHALFHLFIIILVVAECASVITEILLYSVKRQYECHNPQYSYSRADIEKKTHHLDHGIEICHYVSLSILSIFMIELLSKIYALGFHYWNCKENHKLDYFDAFLAVVSFSTEVYFLIVDKESIIAHSAALIVILRLWHLLRIANAVARCLQKGEEFKTIRRQRRLSKTSETLLIPSSIQAILDLMQEKTECLRRDISVEQSLVDRCEFIDQKCQDAFDNYYGDETKLVEEIQKLHLITRRTQLKQTNETNI
ncbi:unnamed protein product [Adineta ricciae]|uniref:Voltage-gated hydrogen channel 1 n=1 Tax=Adineta ricciae TaxID=249248 RepID=A0A813TDH9_ADIRI|nr:unnamed protein product [Adineta ricciae]CAF1380036.1 unnamed protein product [Adineta ricciae]